MVYCEGWYCFEANNTVTRVENVKGQGLLHTIVHSSSFKKCELLRIAKGKAILNNGCGTANVFLFFFLQVNFRF